MHGKPMLVCLPTIAAELAQSYPITCNRSPQHMDRCCKAPVLAGIHCKFRFLAGKLLTSMVHALLPCRAFRAELDVLQPFRGKELQGVLLCSYITDHIFDRQALLSYAQQQQFKIFELSYV